MLSYCLKSNKFLQDGTVVDASLIGAQNIYVYVVSESLIENGMSDLEICISSYVLQSLA